MPKVSQKDIDKVELIEEPLELQETGQISQPIFDPGSAVTGLVDGTNVKFHTLKLKQNMTAILNDEPVKLGNFVIDSTADCVLGNSIKAIILNIRNSHVEKVERNSGKFGRQFISEADYVKEGLTRFDVEPFADMLLFVQEPEEGDSVNISDGFRGLFNTEIDGKKYALVRQVVQGNQYRKFVPNFITEEVMGSGSVRDSEGNRLTLRGVIWNLTSSIHTFGDGSKYATIQARVHKPASEKIRDEVLNTEQCRALSGK